MRLYVARHGRSNYNDLELFNSDPSVDVHLTELGIEQATKLAENLKNTSFDVIYVSELRRTKQTAYIVNKLHDVQIIADPLLNDHVSGFDDKPYAEYDALYEAAEKPWSVRFNGGESLEDTRIRVAKFLEELKLHDYKSVLVVTSMTIVQAFHGVLKNLSPEETWDISVDTGSYSEFVI